MNWEAANPGKEWQPKAVRDGKVIPGEGKGKGKSNSSTGGGSNPPAVEQQQLPPIACVYSKRFAPTRRAKINRRRHCQGICIAVTLKGFNRF